MNQSIHPTAVIDEGATLGAGVEVGPYCVVGPDVTLADGVCLKSHVVVDGNTKIGAGTVVHPFAVIGGPSQDMKFKPGDPSELIIGENNVIREHVTINPGHTEPNKNTRVGNNCLFMVGSHVAHDCQVGDNVIMANNATLAGHVEVGSHAVLGGLSAVHQFVRIGEYAMIGGMSGVEQDVIPYGSVMGERARLSGLNLIGLKRNQFERDDIHALRQTYKFLFERGQATLAEKIEALPSEMRDSVAVQALLGFIETSSNRGICQPVTSSGQSAVSGDKGATRDDVRKTA